MKTVQIQKQVSKVAGNTSVSAFETYVGKLDAKQQAAMRQAAKTAAEKKAALTAKQERTLYVPMNERRGVYLFAYTNAVMQFVQALPQAMQERAAKLLHGASMIGYHTEKGNIKIEAGKVTYKTNFFNCDPKVCTDPKRHGAFEYVAYMAQLIATGKLPEKAGQNMKWRSTGTKKYTLTA